jgi:hypothetical protein
MNGGPGWPVVGAAIMKEESALAETPERGRAEHVVVAAAIGHAVDAEIFAWRSRISRVCLHLGAGVDCMACDGNLLHCRSHHLPL